LFSVATTVEDIFTQLEKSAVTAETKWFVTT
jgi:hypothetical protein